MESKKMIFVDTETTGLNPGQICQLSFILANERKIEGFGNQFFKVESMEESAFKTHKLTVENLEELSKGVTFKDKYDYFYKIFDGRKLIAYNMPFDLKFLSTEFWKCGISFNPLEKECSMKELKDIVRMPLKGSKTGGYKNPKLSESIEHFNLDHKKIMEYSECLFGVSRGYHDSRFDTAALYVLYRVNEEMRIGGKDWVERFSR